VILSESGFESHAMKMFFLWPGMQPVNWKAKVKLGNHCGKMQVVTTLCRFQRDVAEVCAAPSGWLYAEFFVLKWSVRPRVSAF